jgi:subtilisin family serine protease
LLVLACALAVGGSVGLAQSPPATKRPVRTAADLPRFTYPVDGTAAALLRSDPATFAAFAARVRSDLEATLDGYDITDRATLRGLLTTELELQVLAGQDDAARATIARTRELEDKPDAKLLSGLRTEAILDARRDSGATSGDAFLAAFAKSYRAKLDALPWAVVGTLLKESKSGLELLSAMLVEGRVQTAVEPALSRTHALSNELAARMIDARFALDVVVPVKAPALEAVSAVVAAHNVTKPDIWAAREVTLTAAQHLTPVRIAIWDSGTDVTLFPGQVFTDPRPARNTDPHGLAYDLENYRAHGVLFPLDAAQRAAYAQARAYLKGFSDLQLSLDTPEASAVRAKIASLRPTEVPAFFEQIGLFGNYVHGTHVSGIAVRGNPAARIVVGRLTFDWRIVPLPPTDELETRGAAAYKAFVDYFRAHHVRVVNMSWGGTAQANEDALEKNGIGKDAAERKRLAQHYFDIDRRGLEAALRSAPEILFVCAAGNANANSTFTDQIPASLRLPNLMTVGAVDQAGDDTSFTSYGPTVAVDANGYQVLSTFPGGSRVRLSGTSMASPNVANLAAKLLALAPALTPADVIGLIRDGATTSADGRRRLIDPKRSVALLRARYRKLVQ